MAPSNPFLDDEQVRQSIIAHDPEMVLKTGKAYGDGDFEIHWDLNRSKEIKALLALLGQAVDDGTLSAGHVTLSALALQLWGRTDEPLERRLRGHFNPGSQLNKSLLNGQLFMLNASGAVENRNRHSEALKLVQERSDLARDRVTAKQEREVKGLGKTLKKAERIAPQHLAELVGVAAAATAAMSQHAEQAQLALESGK